MRVPRITFPLLGFYWTPSGQSQTRWGSNPLECDVLNIGDHTTSITLLTGVVLTVPTADVSADKSVVAS